jgi:hypothetical protein
MESILKKSYNPSRALVFGLLANCILSTGDRKDCPLRDLRKNLTIEQKHKYVMGLSDEEVKAILMQHEECYEKRLSEIKE